MSNLKPLVWFERKDSNVYGNIKHCAQGAGIFYTIMPTAKDVEIFWGDSIDGSSGHRTLKDIEDAKEWVRTDHYPSKMQPYVKPMPTWIDVNERLPEEDGLYLTLRKGFTFEMGNEGDLVPKVSGWNGGRGCFDDDHGNVLFTRWMPLPELPVSKESDCG